MGTITTPAEMLEKLLKEKNLSKEKLAEKSNLSISTVKRMFSTKNRPSRNTIIAVSFALELSVYRKNELMNAYYPEEKVYDQLLKEKLNIHEADEKLLEKGLVILGKYPKT